MQVKHYTFLAGLLLVTGCEKPGGEIFTPPTEKKELTVEDSRTWLERHPSDFLRDYAVLWQTADLTLFEGQKLVIVPIYNPNGELKIAGDVTGYDEKKLDDAKLIFYLDENGDMAGSIMATERIGEPSEDKQVYFFEPQKMRLQSIWKIGGETITGFPAFDETDHSASRTSACGAFDKWINHCVDKTARDTNCWEYVGTVWTCLFDFDDNMPPLNGPGGIPPSGPSPSDPPISGPPINGPAGPRQSGFSPYLNTNFKFPLALGQTKLEMLLNSIIPNKVIPLAFEANVHQGINFTREELEYFDTFSQQDIDAIIEWLKAGLPVTIEGIEKSIENLKRKFKDAEKNILRQYSGGSTVKYRLNILRYGANAQAATYATQAYFQSYQASTCPHCKGNAFKHALFSIFDAESFGREISRQLGEAHESEEPLTSETAMDKKNNAIGLQIYDTHKNGGTGVFYWGSKIGDVMNNGGLVYLINDQETPSNVDDPSIPGPL